MHRRLFGAGANFWRIPMVDGVRTGSTLAGGTMFLFMLFFVIGIALLMMLGFDLDRVDALARRAGRLARPDRQAALEGLLAFVLLICAPSVGWGAVRPQEPRRARLGRGARRCSGRLFSP